MKKQGENKRNIQEKDNKRKKNLLAFRKQKNGKIGPKNPKIFLFLKEKKGKQSNEKETKTRILLLELTITRKVNLQ